MLFSLILILWSIIGQITSIQFSWTDCSNNESIFNVKSLTIPGDPVIIGDPKNPFLVSFDADLAQQFTSQDKLHIKIRKVFDIFGKRLTTPPFPCINGYGSCEHNLCDYLINLDQNIGCSVLNSAGRSCSCPIDPGHVIIKDSKIYINLSNLPSFLLWLTSGDFNVGFEIIRDKRKLACMEMFATLNFVKTNDNYQHNSDDTDSQAVAEFISLLKESQLSHDDDNLE